jgi:multiple sugar transport system substrate-binding protein
MKRKSMLIVLSLVLVWALTACGGSSSAPDSSADASGNPESASKGKVKLMAWHYYSGEFQKVMEGKIQQFNGSQDKVEIATQYIPYQNMMQQISVATVGKSLPDIILMDTVWNSSVAGLGSLEDITDRVKAWGQADNFYEGPLKSALYQDKYYGLPFTSNFAVMYYNKDMLKEAGIAAPPTTWDELRDAAKKLTNPNHSGLGLSLSKTENGTFAFLPFALSAGADYTKMGSPESVEALDYLVKLMDDGSVSKDLVSLPQDDLTKRFAAKQIALMVNGSWDIATVQKLGPDVNFGVTYVPKDKSFASTTGGENWTIVKGKNSDAAWEFVKWMEQADVMAEINASAGNVPPRKDAKMNLQNNPRLEEALPIIQVVTPRGPSPKWPEISDAIQIAMQKAFTKTVSPQDALNEAGKKIAEIIK